MATAETARLIASLELQDKNFTRGIRNVERGVNRVDKKLSAFGGFVNRNLARGVDRFAASLVDGVFAGVESLKELEQQQAQTNAVIKSTGAVAGVSGEEVTKLAEKYEGLNAIIGDEIIRSGENMLLTFTNIHKDAFEPTLEAVLDMNTALGKGPEGLTSTAMQVGKALNDPTKGLTKLQRAGVHFTKGQIKQIKALQKSGDLLGAQKIILKELNREFGGSFAAQGDTTAGKVAKFNDAVEDLQRTFAKALLPIISKVADKLGTFLGDPAVVKGIEQAGETLGEVFDGMLAAAERLPWEDIGTGLKIAGEGAKTIYDWFTKMPSWAQAFLIGGFAATKLPVVGGLISELGKGLIKGVLGINAGVVNVTGGVVNGPGGVPGAPVGGAPGGKGVLGLGLKGPGGLLLGLTGVGLAAMLAEEFSDEISGLGSTIGQGWRDVVEDVIGVKIPTIRIDQLEWPFGPKNTPTILPEIFGGNGVLGGTAAPPPTSKRAGDRPSPGNPGEFARNLNRIGFDKWVTKAEDIKTAVTKTSAEQKAELGNIKNGLATNKAAIDTAKTVASQKSDAQKAELGLVKNQVLATKSAVQVGARSTSSAATRAGSTAANASSAGASRIVAAVWASGAANRPIIQPTNVIEKYTTIVRGGTPSDSRRSGPLF